MTRNVGSGETDLSLIMKSCMDKESYYQDEENCSEEESFI